jgi:hypothetical protein
MAELCVVKVLAVGDILAVQCTAQAEGQRRNAEMGRRGDTETRGQGVFLMILLYLVHPLMRVSFLSVSPVSSCLRVSRLP